MILLVFISFVFGEAPANIKFHCEGLLQKVNSFTPTMATEPEVQKNFYRSIKEATDAVNSIHKESLRVLIQQQTEEKKNLEVKLKDEVSTFKNEHPKEKMGPLYKTSNEKRQALSLQLRDTKKQTEAQIANEKKELNSCVKEARNKFQEHQKNGHALKKAKSQPPSENPARDEFREIPSGPGIILAPGEQ